MYKAGFFVFKPGVNVCFVVYHDIHIRFFICIKVLFGAATISKSTRELYGMY